MTPSQVLKFYKTPKLFAQATEFTKEALYKWKKQGYVPAKSQFDIQCMSLGHLKMGEPYEAKK